MTEHEFAKVRALRPSPPPPSDEVVQRAKERLMTMITEEVRRPSTVAQDVGPTRRPARVRLALVAASVLAIAGAAVGVVASQIDGPPTSTVVISASASPQDALETAARLVSYTTDDPGTGPIRHIRFRNLTDPGDPVYDLYVRPDGSAMVGESGGRLEETDGYLTTAQLSKLPSDPTKLRSAMETLALERGLAFPDEVPERAIFRLAVDLLTDPGVTPDVKAGIYRVLEGFDLTAIKARNLGRVTDADGRRGIGLRFKFEEDATETLVLDEKTGALISDSTVLAGNEPVGGQTYLLQERLEAIPHQSTKTDV